MTRQLVRMLVWVFLLTPATSLGQIAPTAIPPLPATTRAAIDKAVEAELQAQEIVGVAIGVIQDGKVVYVQGYGLADREAKTPATSKTIFNWASNSKPLAAVAAMQLVEKQVLDLDADVRTYVPEFPEKEGVLTTRLLLSHRTGIPHYSNGKIIPTLRCYPTPFPFRDPIFALDKFNQSPLIFTPGEKVSYSSYAYILLSAVVQRAGKEPFCDQIKRRITTPLKMQSLQYDVPTNGQPNWSIGYIKNRQGEIIRAPEEAHDWKHGAGGFKSNVEDFACWAEGLINRHLVSKKTEALMWTAQETTTGEKTTWGLGFVVDGQGGLRVAHNGSQSEATSRMVLYPRARHGVVVMTNCHFAEVGKISTAIYRAIQQN